jgi:phosphoribosylglycinamide formyltransferase-1
VKIGLLASGGGTNVQALLDAAARDELGPGKVVVVGANVPGAGALARATAAGVATFVVDHRNHASRIEFDRALVAGLRAHDVELVVLAGFMRLVTPELLGAFPRRIINIHPALLPAFPGLHAQAQAMAYGVKVAGCTVHFVDEGTDSGAIIAQAAVPVLDGDDEAALQRRILAEEHRLLPAVVRALAEGRVSSEGRRVRVTGGLTDAGPRLRSL